jgi:cytochrome c oxidase subunit II
MLCALACAACSGPFSTLDPASPAAERVALLWWIMFWGSAAILAGVMAAALYALRRRATGISERGFLIGGGLVFPSVVLLALLVWSLREGDATTARADEAAYRVEATASQWRWEFGYPDGGAAPTLNVLHLPSGRPIHVTVRSRDVIHSFWVPRLGGKIDAIPGKANTIRLYAPEPGLYRGQCAEFCGLFHADMDFEVHVHPAEEFAARLASAGEAR